MKFRQTNRLELAGRHVGGMIFFVTLCLALTYIIALCISIFLLYSYNMHERNLIGIISVTSILPIENGILLGCISGAQK